MTLIETYTHETEETLRQDVEEFLSRDFFGGTWSSNGWNAFTLGPKKSCCGKLFREFKCVAGSVHGLLQMRAEELGWERTLLMNSSHLYTSNRMVVFPIGQLLVNKQKTEIAPFDASSILPVEE